jgi:hypothetical protein
MQLKGVESFLFPLDILQALIFCQSHEFDAANKMVRGDVLAKRINLKIAWYSPRHIGAYRQLLRRLGVS